MKALLLLSCVFPVYAHAWGMVGHQVVGELAARLFLASTPSEKSEGAETTFPQFIDSRRVAIGHVSNIPDFSWRDFSQGDWVNRVGGFTHFVDAEFFLGDGPVSTEKLKNLPLSYEAFLKQHEGKASSLIPFKAGTPLHVFEDIGSGPWRSAQFYDLMVKALRCANEKAAPGKRIAHPFSNPQWVDPIQPSRDAQKVGKQYRCDSKVDRRIDFYAAIVFAGLLSHFVADLAQPLHVSANYDGFHTGNGGIHSYFESKIVEGLDESLRNDVFTLARSDSFQKKMSELFIWDKTSPRPVIQWMWKLVGNGLATVPDLLKIDSEVAILGEKGKCYPWGEHPAHTDPGSRPKRRAADDPQVVSAYRPLIIQRLAMSTWILMRLWQEAWIESGKPEPREVTLINLLQPVQVPFIWPDYDQAALNRLKKASRSQ